MNRAWILAALLCLSGCRGFDIEPPSDFLVLEESEWSSYAFRSTSARGVVIGVRELENPREGTLAFWLEAMKDRLKTVRGYALLEERDQQAASGETGRFLRFGREDGSRPYVYWVGLWVTSSKVYVVEAGGLKDEFDKVQPQVETALRGFSIGAL